jgi:hypothetical protein
MGQQLDLWAVSIRRPAVGGVSRCVQLGALFAATAKEAEGDAFVFYRNRFAGCERADFEAKRVYLTFT